MIYASRKLPAHLFREAIWWPTWRATPACLPGSTNVYLFRSCWKISCPDSLLFPWNPALCQACGIHCPSSTQGILHISSHPASWQGIRDFPGICLMVRNTGIRRIWGKLGLLWLTSCMHLCKLYNPYVLLKNWHNGNFPDTRIEWKDSCEAAPWGLTHGKHLGDHESCAAPNGNHWPQGQLSPWARAGPNRRDASVTHTGFWRLSEKKGGPNLINSFYTDYILE